VHRQDAARKDRRLLLSQDLQTVSDLVESRAVDGHNVAVAALEMRDLRAVRRGGRGQDLRDEARVEPGEEAAPKVLGPLEEGLRTCVDSWQQPARIAVSRTIERIAERGRRIDNDREPEARESKEAPLALSLGDPDVPKHFLAERLGEDALEKLDRRRVLDVNVSILPRTLARSVLPLLLVRHGNLQPRIARRDRKSTRLN